MPAPAPLRPFTEKQQRVVDAIGRGLSYPEIAKLLGISVPTVKGHVEAIAHLLPAAEDDADDDTLSTRDRIFLYVRHQRWLAQRTPLRQQAS